MKLILASNSPRRRELLKSNGIEFEVITSDYQETATTKNPFELTKEFALGKAQTVFDNLEDKENSIVLGADTVVYFNGEILGKPATEKDAENMLKNLSNNTHQVITGYAVISTNKTIVDTELSTVFFNRLNDKIIKDYIATKSPLDKAGSYGIQDGFPLVKTIEGSFDNVVGLPTEKVIPLLKKLMK